MEDKKRIVHKNTNIWIRFVVPARACTMWCRDRLIAYSTHASRCKSLMKTFGGSRIGGRNKKEGAT